MHWQWMSQKCKKRQVMLGEESLEAEKRKRKVLPCHILVGSCNGIVNRVSFQVLRLDVDIGRNQASYMRSHRTLLRSAPIRILVDADGKHCEFFLRTLIHTYKRWR
jgi:hypothetical protein